MAIISRELLKVAENDPCHMVVHPNLKCEDTWSYIFRHSILGGFKFYVPIYVLELLLNHKKINIKYLKKQIIYFMNSWAYAITMGNVILFSACTIRHILGKYYFLSSIFLPGFLSGISIFWENPRNRIINTIIFSELVLEGVVNHLKGADIIPNSLVTDTLFFMINNAVFLHLFKTNALAKKATLIWFFDPRSKTDDKKNNPVPSSCCSGEKHKCVKHILKEGVQYFGTGYAFHLIKEILGKFQLLVQNPLNIFPMIAKKKAFYNGLFFGTYVFIYKVLCKYLFEIEGKEKDLHTVVAGFVAGISYCMSPSLQMNLLPPTLTLQLLWMNLREKYKIPKWYFLELCFAFCLGTLYHFRFLKPNYTPTYVKKMMYIATNGKGDIFINNIINHLENRIRQSGIPITKYMHMSG